MPYVGYRYKKRSHLAQLTAAEVRRARRDHAMGITQPVIAQRLGISQSAVSMLLRGLTYKWCQKVA